MIEEKVIKIHSHWGNNVENLFLFHESGSKGLVVVFPGGNYSCEAPLLYYARKGVLLSGYDVLSLEYGFQYTHTSFSHENFNELVEETLSVIQKCLCKNYSRLYFISKSFGTKVAGAVSEKLGHQRVSHLFLTPIPATIPYIFATENKVIVGTRDQFFSQEHIDQITNSGSQDILLIEGAEHSLEMSNDYRKSLEILSDVTEYCVNFVEG